MSEIATYANTVYWTYKIDDQFWNQLEHNFNKKQFRLSSFKPNAVRKGDIILIFKNHKSAPKTGFISVCQVESDMQHNSTNLKIFSDKNMNKFYCELSSVFILDNVMQLSAIKNKLDDFNPQSFRKLNIGENTIFTKLNSNVADQIVPIVTECMPEVENNEQEEEDGDEEIDKDDNDNENEVNEHNNELFEEMESEDDIDDVEVRLGHFPILFDPCKKFQWSPDMNVRINNFKHHFANCDQCKQTDNNEISVVSKFKTSQFHCTDIKNETQINKFLEYYQNVKRWKLEFTDDDKKYDHIIVHRINNPDNLYHGCCIVLW
jgi:hypothetical protein